MHLFQRIGVQFSLVLTGEGISSRLFRLNDSNWLSLFVPQHIIGTACAWFRGERRNGVFALDLVFIVCIPPGSLQHDVNEFPAGLVFGKPQCIRNYSHRFLGLLPVRRICGQLPFELINFLLVSCLQCLDVLGRGGFSCLDGSSWLLFDQRPIERAGDFGVKPGWQFVDAKQTLLRVFPIVMSFMGCFVAKFPHDIKQVRYGSINASLPQDVNLFVLAKTIINLNRQRNQDKI